MWIETPSNPLLKIVDIGAASAIAHAAGARVVVDNTFATPALQRPLALGADAVVHSVTKYLGGHSDLIGGAVVTSDEEWIERLAFLTNAVGAVPGPMDCYLALRGLKTLAVRMRAHCAGARRDRGLPADQSRGRRASTTRGSTTIPATRSRLARWRTSAAWSRSEWGRRSERWTSRAAPKLFFLAESLGGVESLIEVPGPMTHASVAESPLEVPDDLVRLSVGHRAPRRSHRRPRPRPADLGPQLQRAAVRHRQRDRSHARSSVVGDHVDREPGSPEPRVEPFGVARHLDPLDPRHVHAMLRLHATRHADRPARPR